MRIIGNRSYATGIAMIVVAVFQFFGVIEFDQEQFLAVQSALTGLLGFFIRAGINNN